MRKERISPSISYLIELVVAILFFAASCVICVNIFYQASAQSKETDLRFRAMNKAQTIAEQAIASNQPIATGSWQTDENWNKNKPNKAYTLVIKEQTSDNQMHTYQVSMHKDKKVVVEITFKVLVKEERL